MISSLKSRSSTCEVVILGGVCYRLHCQGLLCQFHFVGFLVAVSWNQWGIVLVCSYFGSPGAIPYQIRILETRFPLLATFVLLHHFSV